MRLALEPVKRLQTADPQHSKNTQGRGKTREQKLSSSVRPIILNTHTYNEKRIIYVTPLNEGIIVRTLYKTKIPLPPHIHFIKK
jgi:hypothetical protein